MADTKISALTSATTPLAGTEVLPIVQSSVTKKVSVASLTEGRTVSDAVHLTGTTTRNTTYNPNLQVQGTAGDGSQGILVESYKPSITFFDFSGGTPAVQRIANDSGYLYFEQDTNQDGTFDQVNAWVTPAGNIGFASGKGIDFSAASHAAGMTSELLNDYEEGTWTPTWNGGSVTINNTCYYTKIGRQVTVTADITFGTSASASDSALTLPFTGLGPWGGGSVNYTDISATASVNVQASTGTVNFRSAINGGNLSCVLTASKRVIFIASYFTS